MSRLAASLILVAGLGATNALWADCDATDGIRSLEGPKPLTVQLKNAAMRSDKARSYFFEPGTFHSEAFRYLGLVGAPGGRRWHVVALETIWGQACRSTRRILLFSEAMAFAGAYSPNGGSALRLVKNAIVFEGIEEASGDSIRIGATGLPESVLIDGERVSLEK